MVAIPWWSPFAFAIALSVVVVVIELRTREIPNTITLGLLLADVPLAVVDGRIGSHFGGFAISAIVCLVLYRQDALGGGGVKWTCALCTLLGARDGVLMMFVAGVLVSAWLALAHLRRRPAWFDSSPFLLVGVLVALANVLAKQRGLW